MFRIRIQVAQKHVDPKDLDPDSDPDPQHCFLENNHTSSILNDTKGEITVLKTERYRYLILQMLSK